MTASLIVAGLYELIGSVVNPEYRVQAGGLGLGDGEPDTTTLASLLLDGDSVSGDRTKNRHVTLRVKVIGSTTLDLAAKDDLLRTAVAASTWTLQYTPDGGLPVIYDCSQATPTTERPQYVDGILETFVTFAFEASPFGRSPSVQTVTVAAQSQLDSFDTAPTGATLDTTTKIEGTGSAQATGTLGSHTPSLAIYNFAPISRTFPARNYSTFANFAVEVGFGGIGLIGESLTVGLTLTLSSASGSTTYPLFYTTFGRTSPFWNYPALGLTGGTVTSGTGVTLSAVTGYSLQPQGQLNGPSSALPATITVHFDNANMSASSSAITATTRGELLLIPNILGSARTPVSIAATGTISALLAHRPPSWQDANAQILTGVAIGASPSTPAASTIAANNANFAGTYSAVLGVSANGAAGSNTVSVTVAQLENGTSVATKVLTATYTSPQADGLVRLKDAQGQDLVLPLRATPADNTLTTYTFAPNHSAGGDTYSDFMLLDTRGQTVIADPPAAVAAIYVDEPAPGFDYGKIYASATNRTAAYCIDDTSIDLGPFVLDPGNNRMLLWSDTATPTLTVTCYPRWRNKRPV